MKTKNFNKVQSDEKRPDSHYEFTREQFNIVQDIKNSKNYYEMLHIDQNAKDADIQRAYRKIALKLHPDKNKAPGATDAFASVRNAVTTLLNPIKRKQYDTLQASDSDHKYWEEYRTYNNCENVYRNMFSENSNDDDYVKFFFHEDYSYTNRYGRPRRFYERKNAYNNYPYSYNDLNPTLTFALSLLAIVFLGSLMASLLARDPNYSLQRTQSYPVKKLTSNHKIPYYVKSTFNYGAGKLLHNLEQGIEEEYIRGFKRSCAAQRSFRDYKIMHASKFGSQMDYENAVNIKVPACEELSKMGVFNYS